MIFVIRSFLRSMSVDRDEAIRDFAYAGNGTIGKLDSFCRSGEPVLDDLGRFHSGEALVEALELIA